jgi:hypothetical protein
MATLHSFTSANPFYKGASMRELATLFEVPLTTVKDRIVGLAPCAKRHGTDVYSVKDAASRLVSVLDDEETVRRVLRMKNTQVPPTLRKELWQAELARQKYEVNEGNLWETSKVVEKAGEAFKMLRLSLQLMADRVDRIEGLSQKQRQAIYNLVDTTLQDMRDRLIDAFTDQRGDTLDEESPQDENVLDSVEDL